MDDNGHSEEFEFAKELSLMQKQYSSQNLMRIPSLTNRPSKLNDNPCLTANNQFEAALTKRQIKLFGECSNLLLHSGSPTTNSLACKYQGK